MGCYRFLFYFSSLKLRTLDWAVKSGDIKLQDFFYPIGAVASSKTGVEIAWAYLKENLELVKSMLESASPSLMDAVIVYSIRRFVTSEEADDVENFFKANPIPSSDRRIGQAVESIRSTGKFLDAVRSSELATASFWKNVNSM